jgi:hypothetical protein
MSSAKRGGRKDPRKRPKKETKVSPFNFWNPGYFDAPESRPDESHEEDDDAPVPLRRLISKDPRLVRLRGDSVASRLRSRRAVDDSGPARRLREAKRAEIEEYNRALARVGEGPVTAEESAMLCKMQLARLGRLPPDDPDADEIKLFLAETDRMCAAASWPARDDTVAARVRKRHRS